MKGSKNRKLARSFSDAALGKLLNLLKSKVEQRGGQIIKVGCLLEVHELSTEDDGEPYFALAARVGLLVFLLKALTGRYVILAIPLAAGITATLEACLLCLLLLWFLRIRIKRTSSQPEVDTLA